MSKIEISKIDTTSRNYLDVLKQVEYFVASATSRGISVLKISCDPDNTLSKVVKSSLKRASRRCKALDKIEFFIFGENFNSDDSATAYLCEKAEFVRDDEDFGANNENIVILYIKQKRA